MAARCGSIESDGLRVSRLGFEQVSAALLELGDEIGWQWLEPDALGPDAPQLPQPEAELRHGDRKDVPLTVVELIGAIEPLVDVRRTGHVVIELDPGEAARAESKDVVDGVQIGASEQRVADRFECLPVLEVRVERCGSHQRGAGSRRVREAPGQFQKRLPGFGAILQPF